MSKDKMKEDYQERTLEQLLNKRILLMNDGEDSYLIVTCNNLHKKRLKEFEVEDLRILISQNIGLKYLIPLAIQVLEKNILAEGDFYEGDLLKSVLTSEDEYWNDEKANWATIIDLYESSNEIENLDMTEQVDRELIKAFTAFKNK